jgi:hypothetical protein
MCDVRRGQPRSPSRARVIVVHLTTAKSFITTTVVPPASAQSLPQQPIPSSSSTLWVRHAQSAEKGSNSTGTAARSGSSTNTFSDVLTTPHCASSSPFGPTSVIVLHLKSCQPLHVSLEEREGRKQRRNPSLTPLKLMGVNVVLRRRRLDDQSARRTREPHACA